MPERFVCSIWNNGANGWGVRVGAGNRRFFDKNQPLIAVELDGIGHAFNLTPTFWTTCPEFRGKAIRDWLLNHGVGRQNMERFSIILEVIEEGRRFTAHLVLR